MSDEMATKVEQEKTGQQAQTDDQAAQKQARLWMVMLVLDPETGEFFLQPNANVKKTWQLDALLGSATKQNNLTATARVTGELVGKMMEGKKGKKLFGL